MTETQTQTDKALWLSFDASDFAALGNKGIEAFVNTQAELLDEIHARTGGGWIVSNQTPISLPNKRLLSSARTIPEAMAVSRDWARVIC